MSGTRGIIGGMLGLALLDAALTTQTVTGGASAVGGVFKGLANVLDYWLDRTQPLIPDLHSCSGGGGGGFSVGGIVGDVLNPIGTVLS